MSGKTVTFSALSNDGTIRTVTGIVPTSGTDVYLSMFNCYVGLGLRSGKIYVFFSNAGNEMAFRAFKLELGTVSTLHLDPPMDHAVELLKCQRFFQIRSTNNVPSVDLSPTMRITPTVTGSGPYYYSADL